MWNDCDADDPHICRLLWFRLCDGQLVAQSVYTRKDTFQNKQYLLEFNLSNPPFSEQTATFFHYGKKKKRGGRGGGMGWGWEVGSAFQCILGAKIRNNRMNKSEMLTCDYFPVRKLSSDVQNMKVTPTKISDSTDDWLPPLLSGPFTQEVMVYSSWVHVEIDRQLTWTPACGNWMTDYLDTSLR